MKTFSERRDLLLQYIAPHRLITACYGLLANWRYERFKNWGIKRFIRIFEVDMSEAVVELAEDYHTFNQFFTRQLKPELRPIAQEVNELACPIDGCVSEAGAISDDQIFQAKGHHYSLAALLGGEDHVEQFRNGTFATLYLSPKDYHRVHMPLAGRLTETIHIPGRLFSVSPLCVNHVPGVFARNERLVCFFETEIGPVAIILVGAMIVASIQTAWGGLVSPPHAKKITREQYTCGSITLEKGAEMGLFQLGSTAIVLFPKNTVELAKNIQAEQAVKMGQLFGTIRHASTS